MTQCFLKFYNNSKLSYKIKILKIRRLYQKNSRIIITEDF